MDAPLSMKIVGLCYVKTTTHTSVAHIHRSTPMSDADADADAIFTIEEREKLRAEILERDTLNAALTKKIEILEATLKATSANSITADNAANPEAALDEIDSFIRTVNNNAPSGDTSYSNDDKTMLVTKKRLRKDEVGMSLEKQKPTPFLGYARTDKEHNLLVETLTDGTTNSVILLDNSENSNIKRLELAEIIHEVPSEVVGMLFNESTQGDTTNNCIFKRYTLQEDHQETMRKVYWQHEVIRGKFVEYLLELRLESTDDYKSLKITPSDETKLSDDALKKLVEISKGVSVSKVQRVGQTAMTLIGTLAVEMRESQGPNDPEELSQKSTLFSRSTFMDRFKPSSSKMSRIGLSSIGSTDTTSDTGKNKVNISEGEALRALQATSSKRSIP
ncbi:hypothetical protein TrCOL_g10220 [Triparma columacea]|uniref:Uncharacterized protein n=1 Tax=Triparma columacea TaxID=722753 RepID=A0A9W7L7N3_9STRA|nr:hypothetical protein TrCOL_g10220 [Triparma columacea]